MWRLLAPILLCVLTCGPAFAFQDPPAGADNNGVASEPAAEPQSPSAGVRPQVYPAARLATLFPAAVQISFGVAVVPDPLVPRYRRPYDLEVVALELGMLEDGYVLDRFYLPWNDDLRNDEHRAEPATAGPAPQQSLLQQAPMRYRYGLMIFRCDGWRVRDELHPTNSTGPTGTGSACNAPVNESSTRGARIRALYIVTDTATKGIESEALLCAIERINSQLPAAAGVGAAPRQRFPHCWQWRSSPAAEATTPAPQAALLSYPDACQSSHQSSTLLVLGPNFSGSVDSAGEAGKRLQVALGNELSAQPIKSMCLLSSSATDSTNEAANELWNNSPFPVRYESLALDNGHKLRDIAHLLPALVGELPSADSSDRSPVAILAEGSTYGYGVCGYADDHDHAMTPEVRKLCLSARRLYFPANIADIRYGMQQAQQRQSQDNPFKVAMPSGHLSLNLGAENGSEYPESRQSALTSVGIQLALEQVLGQLQAHPPKMVIVVATDVRDRLFLFDELRKRLARAMLVDLESDNLISHPDFLHASRGALAIGSAELTPQGLTYGCKASGAAAQMMSTWSTDFQAILADAVSRLYVPGSERSRPCDASNAKYRRPIVQVISLEGLKSLTKRDSEAATTAVLTPVDGGPASHRAMLASAEISAPFFCLGAAWLLLGPLVLPHLRPARVIQSRLWLVNTVVGAICLAYPITAFLLTRSLHQRDHDNLTCLVTLLVLGVALAGLVLCILQVRQATRTSPPANLRNIVGPVLLALAAACFATMPSIWYASVKSSLADHLVNLDVAQLEDLGLDPNPGLAFLLLVTLATVTLLYSCVVLATSAGIVNRNSAVLRQAREGVTYVPAAPSPDQTGALPPGIAMLPSAAANDGMIGALFVPGVEQPQEHPPEDPEINSQQPPPQRELRGALNLNPLGVFLLGTLLIGAIVIPDLAWGDIRLTVFGPLASRIALLALGATSLAATVLLACSLGMARRIFAVSRYLVTARKRATKEEPVGLWPADDVSAPRVFPTTPALARAADGAKKAKELIWGENLNEWRKRVSGWLYEGNNDARHRMALFTLLATELSVFRWCILGTVLCALASIGAVYLFPIEADPLVIYNLVLLVGIGAIAGLAATTFERDALLSNILCNRPAPRKFSTPLFVFIAVPFIALAVAFAIAQVPGVLDWGGGVLQLLGALGLH
jgi:hypothetical protein